METFEKYFRNQTILIVGFASKTGLAVARFLSDQKARFSVSDTKSEETIRGLADSLPYPPLHIFTGEQTLNQLNGVHRVIIAPGVPRTIPLLREAADRGIPVDTEIAFSIKLLENTPVSLIGITGTDGKSTTSALTHHLLKQKFPSYLLGNFGDPLITRVPEIRDGDKVVLELSSYQLEDGEKYRLNGATLLNIAPDHLNRYSSINAYREAKEKIFLNQRSEDIAVLNRENPFYDRWKNLTQAKILDFSLATDKADICCKNDFVFYQNKKIVNLSNFPLKGSHNLENLMTACAFALFYGLNPEEIQRGVSTFEGLEHRSEYLGNIRGIDFINDSKSTTVQAVIKSLSCPEGSVILILGGSDKNLDFRELNPFLTADVKKIICYGETGEKIARLIEGPVREVIYSFDEAVKKAISEAKPGDTVLLSPGCASFDQFSSFEERGNRFKELVKEYEKENI